ncbi:hypothetical protein SAMN05216345_11764 [Cupriavidus sp. YR651]|uniref:hypothetical protein n=1 Tax=Cupriavidus sp. YR651 TaxID=1855315 RepID=UPI00087F1312|nr:hypothetical protein [Cupriavidus sp. YR651]SDD82552.1 hypothetical protein SAMN05216345_11764 [Cupriavidus sp. YR651]
MRTFIAACCLMPSASVLATTSVPMATAQSALQLRQLNDISYVTGGIGSDEAAAMRQVARQFNVRIHFVDSSDSSALSDVTVTLFNARREIVLLVLSEGPYLYMNLPRGNYRAVVRYGGILVSRSITVKGDSAGVDLLLRLPTVPVGSDGLITGR